MPLDLSDDARLLSKTNKIKREERYMRFFESLYIFLFSALGISLFLGFSVQTYRICVTRDYLREKAKEENLYELPSIKAFIGNVNGNSISVDQKAESHAVEELTSQPLVYIGALIDGLPFSDRIATILLFLTLLVCGILRPRLRRIGKLRNSFDPLIVMSIAYVLSLIGYVFSWVDYNSLIATANGNVSGLPLKSDYGMSLVDDAFSRISIGVLIASFGILLVARIVVDARRIYLGWRDDNVAWDSVIPATRLRGRLFQPIHRRKPRQINQSYAARQRIALNR